MQLQLYITAAAIEENKRLQNELATARRELAHLTKLHHEAETRLEAASHTIKPLQEPVPPNSEANIMSACAEAAAGLLCPEAGHNLTPLGHQDGTSATSLRVAPNGAATVASLRAANDQLKKQLAERHSELAKLAAHLAVSESAQRRAQLVEATLTRLADRLVKATKLLLKKNEGSFGDREIDAIVLQLSGLFDHEHFCARYPEYAGMTELDTIRIYLSRQDMCLSPGARFDAEQYLSMNPDVRASKLPALLHYLMHGLSEGRNYPAPIVDGTQTSVPSR